MVNPLQYITLTRKWQLISGTLCSVESIKRRIPRNSAELTATAATTQYIIAVEQRYHGTAESPTID